MYNNRSKGFTLIELLVVIAIIGVLSAVVLASLQSARSKGSAAAIKSNLDTVRVQANLYLDSFGDGAYYSDSVTSPESSAGTQAACAVNGTLFTESTIRSAIASADKAAGGTGGATPDNVKCANDGNSSNRITQWAVWAPIVDSTSGAPVTTWWCVDSTNVSKEVSIEPAGTNC